MLVALVYIPADATNQEDIIRLFAMVGTTFSIGNNAATLITNYTWNIRIEQIDCLEGNQRQGTNIMTVALAAFILCPTPVAQGVSALLTGHILEAASPGGIERVNKIVMYIGTKLCYCLQKLQTS